MIYKPARLGLAALFALAGACDEGFTVDVTVIVPEDVAALYTTEDRGLVVVRIASESEGVQLTEVGVVCGDPAVWSAGTSGFGALPDVAIAAWIERLPAGDPRSCGEIEDFVSPKTDWKRDEDEPQVTGQVEAAQGCNDSNREEVELTLAVAK